MEQNYLWLVQYEYRQETTRETVGMWLGGYAVYDSTARQVSVYDSWHSGSRTFKSKLAAMKFVNKLRNNSYNYRYVTMKKWFGC